MRRYSEIKKSSARAQQAWVLLTGYARDHRITSYNYLGRIMQETRESRGLSGPVLSHPLGDIFYFCQYNDFPP